MSKYISLTYGKFALVDDGDFAELSKYKCAAIETKGGYWYAVIYVEGKTVFMHRMILGLKRGDGIKTIHRNDETLDNRRCNLQKCNIFESAGFRQKRQLKTRCSSRYKGVQWRKERNDDHHRERGCWRASITYKRKTIYLGSFDLDKEIDAAKAYDRAALQYLGEFARLNTNPVDCQGGAPRRTRHKRLPYQLHREKGRLFSSSYRGVSWDKTGERWRAEMRQKGKHIYLGSFDDEIDAAKAYDRAALQYFGESALLNTNPVDCQNGALKRQKIKGHTFYRKRPSTSKTIFYSSWMDAIVITRQESPFSYYHPLHRERMAIHSQRIIIEETFLIMHGIDPEEEYSAVKFDALKKEINTKRRAKFNYLVHKRYINRPKSLHRQQWEHLTLQQRVECLKRVLAENAVQDELKKRINIRKNKREFLVASEQKS